MYKCLFRLLFWLQLYIHNVDVKSFHTKLHGEDSALSFTDKLPHSEILLIIPLAMGIESYRCPLLLLSWAKPWRADRESSKRTEGSLGDHPSKWLITSIYKPWSSAIWKGSHITPGIGDLLTITVVINHFHHPGMMLQVQGFRLRPEDSDVGRVEKAIFRQRRLKSTEKSSGLVEKDPWWICRTPGGCTTKKIKRCII